MITGTGQVAEMLAAHPGVDIVAVAGLSPPGATCGETLKPVTSELRSELAEIGCRVRDPLDFRDAH